MATAIRATAARIWGDATHAPPGLPPARPCRKVIAAPRLGDRKNTRSEEHTSELQSHLNLVCRLLLDTATTEIYTLSLHDALPISTHAPPGLPPARPCRKVIAAPRLGDRKNTQPRSTTPIVAAHARKRPAAPGGRGRGRRARTSRSPQRAAPWTAPQITKFQRAPCHSPPSSIVIIRFT